MDISPQRAGELMFLADPGRVIGGLAVGLRDAAILALVAAGLSGGEIERLRADAVRMVHGRVVAMVILPSGRPSLTELDRHQGARVLAWIADQRLEGEVPLFPAQKGKRLTRDGVCKVVHRYALQAARKGRRS